MTFSELGLSPFLIDALAAKGYDSPTPVQRQAIPAALGGRDLLVSSQTGSGKTAAFLLPSLQRISVPSAAAGIGPRVLVLTPTRELALQVQKGADAYAKGMRRARIASVVGGSPYALQLKALKQPLDILVATPGRLLDHLQARRVDFSRLEVLVLDEADRMLDMGFIDDIEAIVARTPANRQTLLFSATLDGVVGKLAGRVTRGAQRIEIAAAKEDRPQIDQRMLFADDFRHKTRLLDALLRDVSLNQALVFTATKKSADDLSISLTEQGFAAAALHGDMTQRERNRTLTELRRGAMRVLVATDVAARGIDVPGISHVINFDLPRQAEDYVHRIGRTGRAGRSGVAVSLVAHHERRQVRDIERYTAQAIQVDVISGLEPAARPRPAPAKPRGAGRPAGYADRRTSSRGAAKPAPARRGQEAQRTRGSRFER
ncbi:MAG TPA: DEAD/DEAH box helicase [Rhodocyclaceae bacterium]|jgi:superfamily II DNA/RNA helicase|nr:DEAD/DEAH box helicase [Rhodocyclaceae bacterium]